MKKLFFLILLIPLLVSCGEKQSYKIISNDITVTHKTKQNNTNSISLTEIPKIISPVKEKSSNQDFDKAIIIQSSSESSDLEKEKILNGIETELNSLFDNVDKLDIVNENNINF